MADESEKRFHAIMDKLFHAPPKPKSKEPTSNSTSLSGVQLSRGKKRPHMVSILAVVDPKSRGGVVEELRNSSDGTVQAPLCRPWDRGDLLKRLATFKSMTWFAKPEVVNAVNCASRGWINVDMDIIACESCGARLFFSTLSSCAQQQVEKAALVFSLKLNNGHKLLCPWGDNACDETLAQFPPTPVADLVDNYKKRCAALSQLVALPVISSSAIDFMRSPQLEHFLNGSSTLEYANKSAYASTTEHLGNECDELFSILYYQAQKLISLCGWEPRSLPYIVDFNREDQSFRDGNLSDPSLVNSYGWTPSISVYSSGTGESVEANEDPAASGVQYDPNSVVLDCRLCGASVGLWAFCTTPRPVESIRLISRSEVNDENSAVYHVDNSNLSGAGTPGMHVSGNKSQVESREHANNTAITGTTSSNDTHLNLTIGGGPSPAEQNFRPTISFPVIGQNLMARFSSEFESRDDVDQPFKALYQGSKEHSLDTLSGQHFKPPEMRLIQGETLKDSHCSSKSNEQVEAVRDDSNSHMSLGAAGTSGNEIPETSKPHSNGENPLENTVCMIQSASTIDKSSENATSVETADPDSIGNGKISLNNTSLMDAAASGYLEQNPGTGTICDKQVDSQDCGVLTTVHPVNNNSNPYYLGKDLKQLSVAKSMEFDSIRQHRHFCPWIVSSGNCAPGWKQTLFALPRQKEFSCPPSTNSPLSSLIEVDDPVGSVKKLLTPLPAKRKKLVHGSS